MKDKTYEWIWRTIENSMTQIEDALNEAEKSRLHFRKTYGSKSEEVVWDEYVRIRDSLKKRCYSKKDQRADNILIDHHKIASCFCNVLISKKMFAFDIDNDISHAMLLSNYLLAYQVSLQIIYYYLSEFYISSNIPNKNEIVNKLKTQKTLFVPKTTIKHDPYNIGRVKTLALNDYYGIEFDLLCYADMMYWIEHYNRQILENQIELTPYDPDHPLT